MVVVWEGQRGLDPQRCIGHAVFDNGDSMAGMQREAVCSVFYSFLGMHFEWRVKLLTCTFPAVIIFSSDLEGCNSKWACYSSEKKRKRYSSVDYWEIREQIDWHERPLSRMEGENSWGIVCIFWKRSDIEFVLLTPFNMLYRWSAMTFYMKGYRIVF